MRERMILQIEINIKGDDTGCGWNCEINFSCSLFVHRMPSAAPPAAENGAPVPKTELQELQLKAQQQTDEVKI